MTCHVAAQRNYGFRAAVKCPRFRISGFAVVADDAITRRVKRAWGRWLPAALLAFLSELSNRRIVCAECCSSIRARDMR